MEKLARSTTATKTNFHKVKRLKGAKKYSIRLIFSGTELELNAARSNQEPNHRMSESLYDKS